MYQRRFFILLWICLVLFYCSDAQAIEKVGKLVPRANWWLTTVDGTEYVGFVGKFTSIVLDANNYPHISYYDNVNQDLKYAHWDGIAWQIETVDTTGNVGYHTSIALDSQGRPHISYGDASVNTDKDLKYAYWDGTSWQIQVVHTANDAGGRNSLVLDKNDYPHIGYCESITATSANRVYYAKWDGTQWITQVVADLGVAGGVYPSMDLDSNGLPHFSYYNSVTDSLMYAYWDGTQWVSNVVEVDPQLEQTCISIDSQDLPHIVYIGSDMVNLKYAHFDGTTWTTTVVDSGTNLEFFERVSIALDANDLPHLAYWEYDSKDLRYAHFDGTDWGIQIVDCWGKVGSHACITLDSDNNPHITYHYKSETPDVGEQFGSLRYAYISDDPVIQQGWQYRAVDDQGFEFYVGKFGSMVLDSNDYPHIVYVQDNDEQISLKYSRWNGSSWVIQTLSTEPDIWGQASIDIDTNQKLHISYCGSNYITYGTNRTGAWVFTQIANTTGPTCLALDSNQRPHIAYSDETNQAIGYAYWDGSTWQTQVVDSGSMGGQPSIDIDSNNFPHISYYDKGKQNLRYARWDGTQWYPETLDTEVPYGKCSSIKVGTGNTIHISYSGEEQGDPQSLKYAYWDGSKWTISIVDNTGSFCNQNSLELDTNGNPHISYYDYLHKDLKYAYWNPASRAWITTVADSSGNEGKFNSLELDRNNEPHISYVYANNWSNNFVLKYAFYIDNNNLIHLVDFGAKVDSEQVLVYWETSAEVDNAGFYVWRSEQPDGIFVRLNDAIIPSEGGSTWGAVYSYRDPDALHGQTYYYKLEDVDYQGKSTLHGPVKIDVQK